MATEQEMQKYEQEQQIKIADIFSHLNKAGNSIYPCSTCKNKRGIPEKGYDDCVVCMAEYIEQQRLNKLPGYRFFWIIDNIGSFLILAIFAHICWSWHKHWVDSFALDWVIMMIVWNLHDLVARRTRGKFSLEAYDRRNRNRAF